MRPVCCVGGLWLDPLTAPDTSRRVSKLLARCEPRVRVQAPIRACRLWSWLPALPCGLQGREERISKIKGWVLFPERRSQIISYLKGKFHSTGRFVQLCEAADVVKELFPKDHQTLNFSCQRGADRHGYPCYYQTLRRKVNSVLSS